jgi:hypothetical protein
VVRLQSDLDRWSRTVSSLAFNWLGCLLLAIAIYSFFAHSATATLLRFISVAISVRLSPTAANARSHSVSVVPREHRSFIRLEPGIDEAPLRDFAVLAAGSFSN